MSQNKDYALPLPFSVTRRVGILGRTASESMLSGISLRTLPLASALMPDENDFALAPGPKKLMYSELAGRNIKGRSSPLHLNSVTAESANAKHRSHLIHSDSVKNYSKTIATGLSKHKSKAVTSDTSKNGTPPLHHLKSAFAEIPKHRSKLNPAELKKQQSNAITSELTKYQNTLASRLSMGSKSNSFDFKAFFKSKMNETSASTLRNSNVSLSKPTDSPLTARIHRSRKILGGRLEEVKNQFARHARSYSADVESRHPRPRSNRIVETSYIRKKQNANKRVMNIHGDLEQVQGKVNQYYLLRDIAYGSFGRVILAKDEVTFDYYACKQISKNRLRKKFRFNAKSQQKADEIMAEIKREVGILKTLPKHSKIVNLVEVLDDSSEDDLFLSIIFLIIVFELCEQGPLMSINAFSPVEPFSEDLAKTYFRDVVLGLEYCTTILISVHFKRIIHRDIKPENLLLNANNQVLIADFGISHMFEDGDNEGMIYVKNASPLFTAPEACSSIL